MIKNCLYCHKEFSFRGTQRKYCCHKCSSDASRGHKDSEETKQKRSKSLIGHPVSKVSRDKLMEYVRIHGQWNKGKSNPKMSGENHPCWRGGITNEIKRRVHLVEWIKVRDYVFERDKYTCRFCHKKCKPGEIDCHHIVPHRLTKNDDPSNLISLCKRCHTLADYNFRKYEKADPYYSRPELFGEFQLKYAKL